MSRTIRRKAASSLRKPVAQLPADAPSWPLQRAYAPWRDCWNATGCGSVICLRQAPDGRVVVAATGLVLLERGLLNAITYLLPNPREVDGFLATAEQALPPFAPAEPSEAAEYAWGALALAESHGNEASAELERFFELLPPVPGPPDECLRRLVGDGGLTPAALVAVAERNNDPNMEGTGKEHIVFTTVRLRLSDRAGALCALEEAGPDFSEDESTGGVRLFSWSREYPRGHWSPLATLGGRQILGSVRVDRSGILTADAQTLSMTAVLLTKLRKLTDGKLSLVDADWQDMMAIEQSGDR